MRLIDELTAPRPLRVKAGDLYAYRVRGLYRFIRVARVMSGCYLEGVVVLYYHGPTSTDSAAVPELDKGDLLLPPLMAFPGCLRDGYTVRVERRELRLGEIWDRHCFDTNGNKSTGPFHDDFGEKYEQRFEPCGSCSIHSGVPELEIGAALGLVKSYEELRALPGLPTPLLDAWLKARGPSRFVLLTIHDYSEFAARQARQRRVSASEAEWTVGLSDERWTSIYLFNNLWRHAQGLGSVATQREAWPGPPGQLLFEIRKRQYDEFHRSIAQAMQSLGVESYRVEDSALGTWLSGTDGG